MQRCITSLTVKSPAYDLLFGEFLYESTRYWMYVAVMDERTCMRCDQYSAAVFTTAEVHRYFPFATEVGHDLIYPDVHPNCRCLLVGARDDWGYTDTARIILAPPDTPIATILVQANITPVAAPGAGADTPTKPSGEDPGFDQLDSDELNKKKKHLKKGWLQIRHVESAGLLRMTVDFWLIRAGFLKAFGKKAGDKMFRDWVKKNHLQVTKPYGKRRKR